MDYYDKFLDTLQTIYNYDDAEVFFKTLNILANLMLQLKDDRLEAATYVNTFKHDRLTVKVIFEKKYNNG